MSMRIKKIITNGKETGAILSANVNRPTTALEKARIEFHLIDYAFNTLYPREGLNIYSEVNSDTPSVVIIRSIEDLPEETVA
jgi:hypothetical protein